MLAMQAGCPIMSHMSWSGLFLAAAMTVASPEKEAASIVSVMPPAPVVASARTFGPEEGVADGSQVSDNPDFSYRKTMVFKSSQPSDSTAREARSWLSTAFRGALAGSFELWDFPEPSEEQTEGPWLSLQFMECREHRDRARMRESFAGHPGSSACAVASLYGRGVNSFAVSLTPTKGREEDQATEHCISGALPAALQEEEPVKQRACLLDRASTCAAAIVRMERPVSMAAGMGRAALSYLPLSRKDRSPAGSFVSVSVSHRSEWFLEWSALPGVSFVDLLSGTSQYEEAHQGRGEAGVSELLAQGLRLLRSAPGILWNLPEQQSCLKEIQV